MKRKLSRPSRGRTLRALTFRYSSESGTSRSPGATQWPTTPGPIMSAMNSYSRPFQANKTGQELAHDFDVLLGAESGEDGRSILAEKTGRALHFPFLIQRTGVDFDLGTDRAFVVVQRFQIDAHPIVLIAALIAEQKRRRAQL